MIRPLKHCSRGPARREKPMNDRTLEVQKQEAGTKSIPGPRKARSRSCAARPSHRPRRHREAAQAHNSVERADPSLSGRTGGCGAGCRRQGAAGGIACGR